MLRLCFDEKRVVKDGTEYVWHGSSCGKYVERTVKLLCVCGIFLYVFALVLLLTGDTSGYLMLWVAMIAMGIVIGHAATSYVRLRCTAYDQIAAVGHGV